MPPGRRGRASRSLAKLAVTATPLFNGVPATPMCSGESQRAPGRGGGATRLKLKRADILRIWEETHHELTAEHRSTFMRRYEVLLLSRFPEATVRWAVSRHKRLEKILVDAAGSPERPTKQGLAAGVPAKGTMAPPPAQPARSKKSSQPSFQRPEVPKRRQRRGPVTSRTHVGTNYGTPQRSGRAICVACGSPRVDGQCGCAD